MIDCDFALSALAEPHPRHRGGALISLVANLDGVTESEAASPVALHLGLSRGEGVRG